MTLGCPTRTTKPTAGGSKWATQAFFNPAPHGGSRRSSISLLLNSCYRRRSRRRRSYKKENLFSKNETKQKAKAQNKKEADQQQNPANYPQHQEPGRKKYLLKACI